MDSLDAQARRLLNAYKAKASPSVEDADAVWSAIVAQVEEPAPGAPAVGRPTVPRWTNWGWKAAAGMAVAAALLVWAGSSVLPEQMRVVEGASQDGLSADLRDSQSAERPLDDPRPRPWGDRHPSDATASASGAREVVSEPLPSEASPPVTEPSGDDGAVRARPPRRRAKAPAPVRDTAVAHDAPRGSTLAAEGDDPMVTLNEERRLLGQARAALRSGNVSQTLAWVHEHRESHPEGLLKEEMALLEVHALCQAGPRSAWKRARARFLAGYPRSPLAAHLEDEDCHP